MIVPTSIRLAARRGRRRVIVFVRNLFRLDEDNIRDELLGGVRADTDALAKALSNTVISLRRLQDQVAFYEQKVPSLKAARKAYDKKLRKAIRDAEKEAQKPAAAHLTLMKEDPAP